MDRRQELVEKFVEWSNHDSPHAGAATDPASVHATNMKFGNLELCVEVEEHDFSDPMELINGYCSCVSSESCQGIMPTVDKYLSNVATRSRQFTMAREKRKSCNRENEDILTRVRN